MISEFNCHEGYKDFNVEKVWKNYLYLGSQQGGGKSFTKKGPNPNWMKKLLKGYIKSM